jgi:hypothetical protein
MKIVINRCYGSFGLSDAALMLYLHLAEIPFTVKTMMSQGVATTRIYLEGRQDSDDWFDGVSINRTDEDLIKTIEILGHTANDGSFLKIVDVPNDVNWYIGERDGMEWVEETHRRWTE